MLCAALNPSSGALELVTPQPADVSGCAVVVFQATDVPSLQLMAFPTVADASAAFGWGFSLVLGSYLAAWAVGAVLATIRKG